MDRPASYREWVVKRVRYLIDLQNKSVAAVEKEMGRSRGYLGDALRGEKRLSLESLLEVLDHLGIDPGEFFSGPTAEEKRWASYPRPAGSEQHGGIAEAEARHRAPADGARDDTRRLVLAVIRALEDKGVLDHEDLLAALNRRKE